MNIIPPSHTFLSPADGAALLRRLERIGRVCYKSEGKITETSYDPFLRSLLRRGHESVIEHASVSVLIVCDRGVSHEIVRHRIASYSQESTRYCNYSRDQFGRELTFVKPCFWREDSQLYGIWEDAMRAAEDAYFRMLDAGASPQEARSILPNSLKTEIVATMDLREWRHFFKLRTAPAAHPQMREVACALLADFQQKIPVLFDDISPDSVP